MTRRRSPLAFAAILLAGVLDAASMAPLNILQDKAFGVLLLGDGADKDFKDAIGAVARKLTARVPLEFAAGPVDVHSMQKGLDRLKAARVKKVVVIPLMTTSNSERMDEIRFVLGIRENPSPEFFSAARSRPGYALVRRVETKLPVVLAPALDDHPLVVEILASRALSLSKRPQDEALVLVGLAPVAKAAAGEYRRTLSALAERVRAKGGFKAAACAVLQPDAPLQAERERAQEDLRKLVRELSRTQRALVVPHVLAGDAASRPILRALSGVFMRYNKKGLLPDERIIRWVEESAHKGAALPDMRLFKDAGRPLVSTRQALPGAPKSRLKEILP
ncbi:MAG TPA: hypothetical protein DEB40_11420 [Elusimicrobia bacterium]|nr:hypothetical protein [Elusimicrobiota bacterium]HBT62342.1 hypothetical protein [Elusimicrobiota bacterium]